MENMRNVLFFIMDTHIVTSLKYQDSKIHQSTLLYPRKKQGRRELCTHTCAHTHTFFYDTITSVPRVSLVNLSFTLFPRTVSWRVPKTHQASVAVGSAVKKRHRSSPGPIIVIKDEPDDESSYVRTH